MSGIAKVLLSTLASVGMLEILKAKMWKVQNKNIKKNVLCVWVFPFPIYQFDKKH